MATDLFYEALGARVRKVREVRGWTQETLAGAIGIATPTLSKYETARKSINLETLRQVSRHLDVPLPHLVDVDLALPTLKPTKSPPPKPTSAQLKAESLILRCWRALGRRDKALVLGFLRLLGRRNRGPGP